MKIAITGGAGFIGSRVIARALELGHEAWRFDRADGEDVRGDLDGLHGADTVIHLAGMLGTSELFEMAEEAVEANVIGSLRILQWCRDAGAGYVGITMPDSSWANVYQATKLCSMRLASAWHRTYGMPVSHVRAFNAFGPGQKHGPGHPQKFLPTFATKAWAGEALPIFGNGLQTMDMIHVDDVARMLVDATAFVDDEVFDAGTGVDITVRYFARMVNRLTGNEAGLEHLPMRNGETEQSTIRAKGEGWDKLDWKPTLDWEQVAEAVHWYKPRS